MRRECYRRRPSEGQDRGRTEGEKIVHVVRRPPHRLQVQAVGTTLRDCHKFSMSAEHNSLYIMHEQARYTCTYARPSTSWEECRTDIIKIASCKHLKHYFKALRVWQLKALRSALGTIRSAPKHKQPASVRSRNIHHFIVQLEVVHALLQ